VRSLLLTAALLAAGVATVANSAETPHDSRCALGIMRALQGSLAPAESLFLGALSLSPKNACALANLGNLAILRGQPGLAVAFYSRAVELDSLDAGLRLDRAIALALTGDETGSHVDAREAVRLAGGADSAVRILGLPPEADSVEVQYARGAAPTPTLTREEVRRLVRASLGPMSKTPSGAFSAPGKPATGNSHGASRSAAPRSEDISDVGALLYWKR
jgi:tetratricopeptide (TPR) repeat protein